MYIATKLQRIDKMDTSTAQISDVIDIVQNSLAANNAKIHW